MTNRHALRIACAALAWLTTAPGLAAARCVDAMVTIDAAHDTASMRLALPAGVQSLALAGFDGYRRSEVLRSPDGSAVVSDDGLRATTPGHRIALAMDVRDNLPQRDRAYAPFLRFGDGTVAIDSELLAPADGAPPLCLRFVPARGQRVVGFGRATAGELRAPGDGRQGGYVAFGTPRVDGAAPLKAFDTTTPAWAVQRLDATFDRLVAYYQRWLPPVAMPAVFVYRMPYPPGVGGNGYHGDRLPASLTLGLLGSDWRAPQPDTLAPMTGFIAHEVFHLWNAANGMEPRDATASIAEEGGADLAAIFAEAQLHGGGQAEWLDRASNALAACLLALPDGGRLSGADLAHGRLPYDCGVPALLALAAANDRRDPAAGYFRAWKPLVERALAAPRTHYRWIDLARANADPRVLAAVRAAIEGDADYLDALRRALGAAGFALVPDRHPSLAVRSRLNLQLVGALMAADCDGATDLWTEPAGFRVGKRGRACHALQAGRTLVAVLDTPLVDDDPAALRDAVAAHCAARATLRVADADGHAMETRCPREMPRIPALWRITAAPSLPSAPSPSTSHATPG